MVLNGSGVDLSLRIWCPDPSVAWSAKVELTAQIKKRFDAEGIEIPYASQNIIVKSPPGSTGSNQAEQEHKDRHEHQGQHGRE